MRADQKFQYGVRNFPCRRGGSLIARERERERERERKKERERERERETRIVNSSLAHV